MDNQPKISTLEAFLLLSGTGLMDAIGIVLVIFGLDDFFILDILGSATQFYFRMKGINKAGYDLAASALEVIPYVGALPLKTIGVLAVIWADRHPEGTVAKITEKAAAKIPFKGGKGIQTVPGIKTPVGGLAQKS